MTMNSTDSPAAPTLFDYVPPTHAAARHTDPATSREAARSLDPKRLTALEETVLTIIERTGGATIEEISRITNLSLVSVSPRIKPLQRKGRIADSGERRLNASGRSAIVWRLV